MSMRFPRRFMILIITTILITACGTPTVATTPTQTNAQAAATLPTPTGAPAAVATPAASAAAPDDTTQARLRVVDAVRKSPNMDV